MHYYIVCAKLVLALVYCNFLKEVRLGGWGTEGPKAPTLGRHASACATILRLRALLCYVLCATFVHALVYCNFVNEVRLVGWDKTRKCVRYYT